MKMEVDLPPSDIKDIKVSIKEEPSSSSLINTTLTLDKINNTNVQCQISQSIQQSSSDDKSLVTASTHKVCM